MDRCSDLLKDKMEEKRELHYLKGLNTKLLVDL